MPKKKHRQRLRFCNGVALLSGRILITMKNIRTENNKYTVVTSDTTSSKKRREKKSYIFHKTVHNAVRSCVHETSLPFALIAFFPSVREYKHVLGPPHLFQPLQLLLLLLPFAALRCCFLALCIISFGPIRHFLPVSVLVRSDVHGQCNGANR